MCDSRGRGIVRTLIHTPACFGVVTKSTRHVGVGRIVTVTASIHHVEFAFSNGMEQHMKKV